MVWNCFKMLLHAKPFRIIQKLPQKLNFRSPIFLHNAFFSKIVVFDLQTQFFDEKPVFFRFLAEIRLRTLIKSPQKQVFEPKRANSVPPATCLKLQSEQEVPPVSRICCANSAAFTFN